MPPHDYTSDAPRVAKRANGMQDLRVAIGSDDPVTRRVFSGALSRAREIEVVASEPVADIADDLARELQPDVVVLDLQFAVVAGLRAVSRIREAAPGARVLAFNSPAGVELGMLCIDAGASGYLSKELDPAALPRVLRGLGRGEAAFSRAFAGKLVERVRTRPAGGSSPAGREITGSERRVVERLQASCTIQEAAAELGMSVATARRHLASARRKIVAHGAVEGGVRTHLAAVGESS